MVIQISRREVLNNLIRFKESLSAIGETEPFPQKKRVYKSLVNRHTGDVHFAWKTEKMADWLEIRFVVEGQGVALHFKLTNETGTPLTTKQLDPLAIRILFETLNVLNKLASLLPPGSEILPETEVLQHLSDIHIGLVQESIEKIPGWSGHLSRIEAEKNLNGRPIGTYLIRKGDRLVDDVAYAIAETNQMAIHVFILTFVEEEGKISDRLLIQTDRGWTICRDEMNLSFYQYHPTLPKLLESMSNQIKTPV